MTFPMLEFKNLVLIESLNKFFQAQLAHRSNSVISTFSLVTPSPPMVINGLAQSTKVLYFLRKQVYFY